jgi:hypothetical protein
MFVLVGMTKDVLLLQRMAVEALRIGQADDP